MNETTPIDIKLKVLDSACLGAILSASECWGNVDYLEEKLKEKELAALHAVLKVKR